MTSVNGFFLGNEELSGTKHDPDFHKIIKNNENLTGEKAALSTDIKTELQTITEEPVEGERALPEGGKQLNPKDPLIQKAQKVHEKESGEVIDETEKTTKEIQEKHKEEEKKSKPDKRTNIVNVASLLNEQDGKEHIGDDPAEKTDD